MISLTRRFDYGMAVRFKFRSSLNFDTVDIEGRSSISVRDLKSKIIRQKNLNICQDFDLVFSDSLTGQGQLSFFYYCYSFSSTSVEYFSCSVREDWFLRKLRKFDGNEEKSTATLLVIFVFAELGLQCLLLRHRGKLSHAVE